MKRLHGFTAVGLLLLPLAYGQVDGRPMKVRRQEVPPILAKAIEAGPKLRYIGTRVIEFRRQGQPVKYSEIVTRDGPYTRIEFPNGSIYEGQIIVETPRERRHYFPDKNEIRVMPPRREEAMHRLARLAKSDRFRLVQSGSVNVAGVKANQVVVSDQAGNVVQRLFIEPRTGLLLKRQLFDPGGAQSGLYQFTSVDLSPRITPGIFRLDRKGAKIIRPVDTLRQLAQKEGFPFAFLRPTSGYSLHFAQVHRFGGEEVLMQFYGSEKGRLSLYVTKEPLDPAKLKQFGRGTVNVYSWKVGGYSYAFVGNQTEDELRRLASLVSTGT